MKASYVDSPPSEKDWSASFFYPHGGILIWVFILLELFTFGIGICSLLLFKQGSPILFSESQAHLDQKLAAINTIVLISSGYLLALANKTYKKDQDKVTGWLVLSSTFLGVVFLYLKYTEYAEKIRLGFLFGSNTFFDLYWMLTSFHAIHIVLGVFFLLYFSNYFLTSKKPLPEENSFDTIVTYWHMCDLIWILIFPVIYLI